MEDTVTNYQFYMNVCRNPFGYSSDEVRTARLYICDHAESMDNLVGKLTRENEALKAELAEAKKDAERYYVLRDEKYQLDEDGPCVSDSFFYSFYGEELDHAVDMLKQRFDYSAMKGT